ncbi:TIGR03087 family PEP-CTERM/XrtA system glycosyltransferase [Candidatus Berkiella cookevillensis]|uniref:TIGR03087 family PEP-CTERM/XrtA system glycosyltransferase n=1 Tax=Candidatus Berkiella cookevillensis TaxID=437022 RepID=A0A0Q9YP82_9GAMM|nr:TIGR03087 family PEP-CTERM/XrtA system glycosyltransferase [Candidatus Berkiella cookevillensis]MCS5709133.1 TIGR03087 family PEP-CTERM/XrtA system glycosyltransferase [Candidatus Berkiella cookevillensis]
MKPILLLVHRLPYPPNKGDKIRSYHLLKFLRQHRDVYLGTFIDDPNDWQYVETVKDLCTALFVLPRRKHYQAIPGFAKSIFKDTPLSNDLFYQPKMQKWVDKILSEKQIDDSIVFSSSMGQYIQKHKRNLNILIDFVDVDSLKWEQYSQQHKGIKKWLYKREGKTLSYFERKLAITSDVNIFVSESEANIFKKRSGLFKNVISIANGVDTEYFNPSIEFKNPYVNKEFKIVFTGMMDYWPNIDAVKWFVTEVIPALQQQSIPFSFYIVGANPSLDLQMLAQIPQIRITGRVEDIRPFLKYADLAVAPLRIARGIQNKVLEALSMNTPIMVSTAALEGIELPQNNLVKIANEKNEWIHQIQTLMNQSNRPSVNSHVVIEQCYAWNNKLEPLIQYLDANDDK